MNKLDELRFNVEALSQAIGEDKKFFSSIQAFVERLQEFTTTKVDKVSKEELRFLAQKIEDFFSEYRPSPSLNFPYIPPQQASSNDNTVKEIYRVTVELEKLSQEQFEDLKPKIEKPVIDQQKQSQNHSTFQLDLLLTNFPAVAKQLKHRHAGRQTLTIDDEYDVQDLLHALLKIYFEDVRPEEYTPSYAGSSSRIDFLLKKDNIVVETKMASKTLSDKQAGEQLIIDIKKYQSHPGCKILYCVVYDPNSFIKNPVALESDLSGMHGNLSVKVFVVPH